MKSTKIFIIFTFLLAFAFQVSAQDNKPKVVWKDFQTEYKVIEYIVPTIKNESDKSITFLPSWLIKNYVTAHLLVLNEKNQKWESVGAYLMCGLTLKIKDQTLTKILPKEEKRILLDFGDVFFSFSDNKFNSKNKFKVSLTFQFEDSKEDFSITSPEFSITGK